MSALLAGLAALLLAHAGFAALALAMERHHHGLPARTRARLREWRSVLRMAGTLALAASLAGALRAWPPADGAVAWFGLLTVAAMVLVLLLAYRPRAALASGATAVALGLPAGLAVLAPIPF